jgi:hypothetical protein
MINPYQIDGPAMVSFSGGRTSAFMLREILAAHRRILPFDVYVTFANTGKEREETLRFVHECGSRWNVPIRWLEWRNEPAGYEEVSYNSASRNGEPFEALIAKKKSTPNWQMRFCTMYLKVLTMQAFMADQGHAIGSYTEAVGLRHDEGLRIFKMLERNEKYGQRCVAPLAKAKITKPDIMSFWAAQPFDLGLVPGEGNCDLCFLKGRGLRKSLIRARPTSADWWIKQEIDSGGQFDRRDSYAGLKEEVRLQPDIFDDPLGDEHDTECGLLCGPP